MARHGSSHHVVYQRHFILIFREGGWRKGAGMVEERESVRQRDRGERRWRSVQGGETERESPAGRKGRSDRFFVVNHRG